SHPSPCPPPCPPSYGLFPPLLPVPSPVSVFVPHAQRGPFEYPPHWQIYGAGLDLAKARLWVGGAQEGYCVGEGATTIASNGSLPSRAAVAAQIAAVHGVRVTQPPWRQRRAHTINGDGSSGLQHSHCSARECAISGGGSACTRSAINPAHARHAAGAMNGNAQSASLAGALPYQAGAGIIPGHLPEGRGCADNHVRSFAKALRTVNGHF
ncbi:hypothetical protein HDZ31DRAFT_78347, partial [Schizophyllum fasciatum]